MEGEEEQEEEEHSCGKDCSSVEIGRVWYVGCVESEEKEEFCKFQGEWEQLDPEDASNYVGAVCNNCTFPL